MAIPIPTFKSGCVTCKFVEVVSDVIGLVVVACILVVNELHVACEKRPLFKERHWRLVHIGLSWQNVYMREL